MFWNKKTSTVIENVSELWQLAEKLGVEKRRFVRVRYPRRSAVGKLPEISFAGHPLDVQDISVGGCLVLDPKQVLGPAVGQDIELTLTWPSGPDSVKARIVSRVDHRRHIQFLDLSASRQSQLSRAFTPGVRGLGVHQNISSGHGIHLDLVEMWSSLGGDSILIENGVHRRAQILCDGEKYLIFRESWPVKEPSGSCTRSEFERLILFLANIKRPSAQLADLLQALEEISKREAP